MPAPKFLLLLATLPILCSACGAGKSAETAPPGPTPPPMATGGPRILCLGDSYTIGQSVDARDRWPVQLGVLLSTEHIQIAPPEIIARTGWTAEDLAEGIARTKPNGPYQLVTLLIGVNNQFQGRDVEEFHKQFVTLLEQAKGFADGKVSHVLVLSIPDYGLTPFAKNSGRKGISKELEKFNAICKEEAQKAGARFVDITPVSNGVAEDKTLLALDGLHPSGKLYAEWAKLALPEALAALKDK